MPVGTVLKKLGSWVTPGAGGRDVPRGARTQTDSGLVREVDCVESRVVVSSSRWHPRGLFSKGTLPEQQLAGPAKRECGSLSVHLTA